jgi:hypothetical protein
LGVQEFYRQPKSVWISIRIDQGERIFRWEFVDLWTKLKCRRVGGIGAKLIQSEKVAIFKYLLPDWDGSFNTNSDFSRVIFDEQSHSVVAHPILPFLSEDESGVNSLFPFDNKDQRNSRRK